jgi:hypothetical protein
MALRHPENLEYVWRAAITFTYANGTVYMSYAGPFRARNHASAAGNYELRHGATEYVLQRSRLEWEDIDRKETP